MNYHTQFTDRPVHLVALILVIASFFSGCSESSESLASDGESSVDSTNSGPGNSIGDIVSDENTDAAETEPDTATDSDEVVQGEESSVDSTDSEPGNSTGDIVSDENTDAPEMEPNTATDSDEVVQGEETDAVTVPNSSVGTDPLTQHTVLVNFDITVPKYQSNELRVELDWGDINLNAMWVGDEFWSVSGEFPAETEHLLTVSFYDRNGDLDLARFTQEFRVGSNVTEAFRISADQFNADQFDTDADGVSNLEELIAGTSPIVDEDSLLEIYDSYVLSRYSRMSVSRGFESRLSEERPYFHSSEASPIEGATIYADIDIDAEGNGTLSYSRYRGSEQFKLRGTRTHLGNTVSWEGSRDTYISDYWHRGSFTNSITVVDDNTRTLVEESVGSNVGLFTFRWEVSANLTGQLIDDTSLCEPVAGTVSITYRRNPNAFISATTISKEIDDSYWRVVNVHNDLVNNETETTEYFAQNLVIFGRHDSDIITGEAPEEEDPFFICDFVDL